MNERTPTCYVIAGPNGAGKTTFAYADHCDETYCLDNRQNRIAPIFEKRAGGEFIIQDKGLYQEMRKVADNER